MICNYKEGFLTKESRKKKGWKKRWCVFNGNQLYYYRAPQTNLLGCIDLSNATKIEFSKEEKYLFGKNILLMLKLFHHMHFVIICPINIYNFKIFSFIKHSKINIYCFIISYINKRQNEICS